MRRRSHTPHIDACSFYDIECRECPLAGIIDPYDETLLLLGWDSKSAVIAKRADGGDLAPAIARASGKPALRAVVAGIATGFGEWSAAQDWRVYRVT
jgi:hypothetical protein